MGLWFSKFANHWRPLLIAGVLGVVSVPAVVMCIWRRRVWRIWRWLCIWRIRLARMFIRWRRGEPLSYRRSSAGSSRRNGLRRGIRRSRKTRSHPVLTPVHDGAPKYELTAPVAMDIGGSLTKLAYIRPPDPPLMPDFVKIESYHYTETQLGIVPADSTLNVDLSEGLFEGEIGCGIIKFLKFQSPHILEFFDFIVAHDLHGRGGYGENKLKVMNATGGGAFRWGEVVKEKLGIEVARTDEMEAMITGLNFLLLHTRYELFTFYDGEMSYVDVKTSDVFPYLLMSVGSGVSILLVDGKGPAEFERVWGSNIGGATFFGLCRLLTDCQTYEEAQELWISGDNSNVDLLVGDIYGHAYESIGLSADTVAASFGKAVRPREEMSATHKRGRRPRSGTAPPRQSASRERDFPAPREKKTSKESPLGGSTDRAKTKAGPSARPEDIARSLMFMVSRNLAALGFLNAQLCGVNRVIFSGNFVRNNPMLWENISEGLKYWSSHKGTSVEPHFLVHDGYLGALGALVTGSGF